MCKLQWACTEKVHVNLGTTTKVDISIESKYKGGQPVYITTKFVQFASLENL